MINRDNGEITFENYDLSIHSCVTRTEILQPGIQELISTQQSFGEWSHYTFRNAKSLGMKFSFTVSFYNENIESVSIMNEDKEFGLSWEDWSLEKEMNRKETHDLWLQKVLGNQPYVYQWGKVFSAYDNKGGFSHIIIRYKN